MEKFSLARITSDEIQDDELIELGPKNRSPARSQEMKLDSKNVEESKYNQTISRSHDQNEGCKSENKVVRALKRIGSRSKSNLRNGPSKTENVKKSKSKLLQSFERLKSLTKIKSRNTIKSSELEMNSPKIKSKDSEALYNVQTSNNAQTTETARRSIIKIATDEQTLNDTKQLSIKISEVGLIPQDKGVQYNDVCAQNKCPLDCKNILITQKEQEAADNEKHPRGKIPEGGKTKAKTKKRCYLIRSKTREKIKSKSLSDLSESQEQKEKKKKDAATKTESRKKHCSKRSASSQSPKKKKKTPPPSPKRKKSKCYGQAQTQTPKQKKSELKKAQKPEEEEKIPEGKDDKKEEKVPVEKDDKKEEKVPVEKDDKKEEKVLVGKDGKKVKSKKKTRKCYYYRKRSKVDKKPDIPPVQPVLSTSQRPSTPRSTPPPTPLRASPASTPKPSKLLTPRPTPPTTPLRTSLASTPKPSKLLTPRPTPPTTPLRTSLASTPKPSKLLTPRPTPPTTPLRTSPASTPKPSKLLTPRSSLNIQPQGKPSSWPSVLSRSVSLIQTSEEEPTPLTDISTGTVIPSHETFPSSTVTIPTTSRTTIPTTDVSHETITVIESDKEIPYTSPSELYTPSDEVLEEQQKQEAEEIGRRRSCTMAGPPTFICNEDFKYPEFRERLNFTQNRGPIPPCLQPVLGPCEGRRCTILKGGERGQVCGVKYATVKITFFPEYTTYEVMRSTEKPPKCIPKCIEEVFVTKYEPKTQSP